MITCVEIFSQNDLERRCRKQAFFGDSILISIGNPRSGLFPKEDEKIPRTIKRAFKKILRLEFNDAYQGDKLLNGRLKKPPRKQDVEKAIRFFDNNKEKYDKCVIHCWAGTSRSTAIGIGVLYKIYKNEDKVIEELKTIRPYALPHKDILGYIDEIYGTKFVEKRTLVFMNYKARIKKEISDLENEGLEEL